MKKIDKYFFSVDYFLSNLLTGQLLGSPFIRIKINRKEVLL